MNWVGWHGPVVPVMGRLRWEDCLSSRVRGQPGQHRDILNSRKRERKKERKGRREKKKRKEKTHQCVIVFHRIIITEFMSNIFVKKWATTIMENFSLKLCRYGVWVVAQW